MKPQCWAEAVVMALKSLRLPLSFAQVLLLLHGAKQPNTQGSGHFYVTMKNTRSKTNYREEESWRQPTFPGQRPSWRGVRASVAGTEAETMPNTDYLLRSQPPFFYSKGPRAYGSCHPQWAGLYHIIIYQESLSQIWQKANLIQAIPWLNFYLASVKSTIENNHFPH